MKTTPRTYGQGDRVRLHGPYGGITGRVVEVIRRDTPPFAGYLVDFGDGDPIEIAAHEAREPFRPMLREWRRWSAKDLGGDFVAWLTDAELEQLRAEYLEEHPDRRSGPLARFVPHRIPGYEPLHLVVVAKQTERYEATKSNGSCLRTRERHFWWVRCLCGLHVVKESASEARALREEHEKLVGRQAAQS
ncbi:hypothetical protein [Actinomadura opuntiae]|uniref:hypothetical protein n=1 Tax=Actinomadura sp. OS1-43 TaxID=604315 RepID=UPI00255A9BFE|nr:hypothetical protein [Actinomadura sp. OS1-43]MDL4812746.1 hypothetical protein [Actinomadura sp. OS1-43]